MTMHQPPITGGELADLILGELGDTEETVWSKTNDIIPMIQDVFYDFVTRIPLIWKRLPLPDVLGQATYTIPASYNFHEMDRAEYDYWAVTPTPARQLMATNGRFESAGNRPFTFLMEGDGISTLRKIGVPTVSDSTKFQIEFFAVGDEITADAVIPIPVRYLVDYVSSGVKAKAYQKDGDGQSIKLAKLWQECYEDGVKMAQRRKDLFFHRRVSNIGSDGKVPVGYRTRNPGSLPAYFPRVPGV